MNVQTMISEIFEVRKQLGMGQSIQKNQSFFRERDLMKRKMLLMMAYYNLKYIINC